MWQSNTTAGRAGSYGVALAAAISAAGAAFLFDSRSGARRRALLRDQLDHVGHQSREFIGKVSRDALHRSRGLYRGSIAHLRSGQADDQIIEARVRTKLGRVSAHPGAIDVVCSDGRVRLRGDVLRDEVDDVLRAAGRVRGVRDVVDDLRVHPSAAHISALQGGRRRGPSPRFEYQQFSWSPAPRALAGVGGIGLIIAGVGRGTPAGYGVALCGAALVARSIYNKPLSHVAGILMSDADGVRVQKTIQIYAEVEEVYDYWRKLEDLPRFMSHVREVSRIDATHYHWVVDGPAGLPIEWDAEITADLPGELIAWRTLKDSAVHSSGVVQFESTPTGGTRLHLRMSYRPPANALGHAVAQLFGRDPKRQIDEDLLRFKTLVEAGGNQRSAQFASRSRVSVAQSTRASSEGSSPPARSPSEATPLTEGRPDSARTPLM